MAKFAEWAKCLIAGFLFLVAMIGLPAVGSESAFQLAYATLAVDALLIGVVLKSILSHPNDFSAIRYFLISGGLAVASWLAFYLIAVLIDATDSSHGGSVWVVAAGSIALVLVGSVLAARKKRTAQ